MSQTISINNYGDSNLVEQTRLDADVAVAVNALVVENTNHIGGGDFLVIGLLGNETTELLVVQSVTGTTGIGTVGNTVLPHNRFDPVNKLFGSQIKLYRAPNVNGVQPADTAFAPLATIDIDIDQPMTDYTDATGSSAYWYKFTYYNPTSTGETNLADSMAMRGGGTGDYCSIEDVRKEAGLTNNRYITDVMIDTKRKAAQSEIDGALSGLYPIPFTAPINPFIADLTARLAAGLLLTQQFGVYNTLNTNNGGAKLKDARAQLNKLQTSQMTLTDTAGNNIEIPGTSSFAGWPNETTSGVDGSIGGDSGPGFRKSTRY